MKGGSSPKKVTAQPYQWGVNVDHEKSLGKCLYDGIYYDGSQYKDIIFFYMKYLMTKYWWVTSCEFVERIIYLKGFFPHPDVSEFHILSYLTPPLFPITDTLDGLLE